MIIYGVGLLAACMLIGVYAGDLIGALLGIDANIGGVGIAMLILIVVSNYGPVNVSIKPITAEGITFWNAMYIPIVIAMAAKQNVFAAVSSGWLAILAGLCARGYKFSTGTSFSPFFSIRGRGSMNLFLNVLETNALITAFVVVALVLWISNSLAKTLFAGKIHGSAIAIILGLFYGLSGRLDNWRKQRFSRYKRFFRAWNSGWRHVQRFCDCSNRIRC